MELTYKKRLLNSRFASNVNSVPKYNIGTPADNYGGWGAIYDPTYDSTQPAIAAQKRNSVYTPQRTDFDMYQDLLEVTNHPLHQSPRSASTGGSELWNLLRNSGASSKMAVASPNDILLSEKIQKQDPAAMKASYDRYVEEFQNQNKKGNNKFSVNSSGLSAIPGLVGNIMSSFRDYKTTNLYINQATNVTRNVGGINYNARMMNAKDGTIPKYTNGLSNIVNTASSGAAAGSALGPYGAIGGMVLGGALGGIGSIISAEKDLQNKLDAARYLNLENNFNKNIAATQVLQRNNARKYGNTLDQPLYEEGKNAFAGMNTAFTDQRFFPVVSPAGQALGLNISKPEFSDGSTFVVTPYGIMRGEPNAMVSPGEELVSGDGLSSFTVPGKKSNKDNVPALLAEGTDGTARTGDSIVLSNKNHAAEYYRTTGDLMGAQMLNPAAQKQNRMMMAKNGKNCLPKFKDATTIKRPSELEMNLPNIISGLGVIPQLLHSYDTGERYDDISYRDSSSDESINALRSLRIRQLPIENRIREEASRAYNANRLANVGGGLRWANNIAVNANMLNSIANANLSAQAQNNQYIAQAEILNIAKSQNNTKNRIALQQWAKEKAAADEAARHKLRYDSYSNLASIYGKSQSDRYKRYLQDYMMSRYDQSWLMDNEETKARIALIGAIAEPVKKYLLNSAASNPYVFDLRRLPQYTNPLWFGNAKSF